MLHPELIELHVVIKGSVQGVGLRKAAKFLADQMSLTGTIGNREDGTVEIFAHGKKMDLYSFLSQLQEAFPGSELHHISFSPISKTTFATFEIAEGVRRHT